MLESLLFSGMCMFANPVWADGRVCVKERERKRERGREKTREREIGRERMCVRVGGGRVASMRCSELDTDAIIVYVYICCIRIYMCMYVRACAMRYECACMSAANSLPMRL